MIRLSGPLASSGLSQYTLPKHEELNPGTTASLFLHTIRLDVPCITSISLHHSTQ